MISPLDANLILSKKLFVSPWGNISGAQWFVFGGLNDDDDDGSIIEELFESSKFILFIPEGAVQTFDGTSNTCSRNRRNEAVKSTFKSSHWIKLGY